MCDCYGHKCDGDCGKVIGMHLADFDTARDEIQVFCKECAGKVVEFKGPRVHWRHTSDDGTEGIPKPDATTEECVVVSLTENAWRNRDGNHPNSAWTENIFEYDGRPKEGAS